MNFPFDILYVLFQLGELFDGLLDLLRIGVTKLLEHGHLRPDLRSTRSADDGVLIVFLFHTKLYLY